jgi:hypothetical protein
MRLVFDDVKPKETLIDVVCRTWEFIVQIKNDFDLLVITNVALIR